MKILHLSDLHRCQRDKNAKNEQDLWIKSLLENIDVAVVTGDVFESENYRNQHFNPYEVLSNVFGDKMVLFCLGNHEFYYRTPQWTREYYTDRYDKDKYNVHCLDVIGHYDVDNVRFLGNVLWYDGSMKTVKNQKMIEFADGTWCDMTIKSFRWVKEHDLCRQQIENSLQTKGDKKSVLCVHCVPHEKLNGHLENIMSPYNAYSGIKGFLDRYKFDWCLCGHTHWRILCEINGCNCVNVGNHLFPPYQHYFFEL